jgi:hypothetical protein
MKTNNQHHYGYNINSTIYLSISATSDRIFTKFVSFFATTPFASKPKFTKALEKRFIPGQQPNTNNKWWDTKEWQRSGQPTQCCETDEEQ